MKKYSDGIKDYIRKMSDEDLRYLQFRLGHRIGGDLAEAIDFLQKNHEVDRLFASASSAFELFDLVDGIDYLLQQEARKRSSYESKEKEKKVTV